MRMLPLWSSIALTGCATFTDATEITLNVSGPEVSGSCVGDPVDSSGSAGRVVADTVEDGSTCRIRIYTQTTAIRWSDVRDEVPPASTTDWTTMRATLTTLGLGTSEGSLPDTFDFALEQRVVTESGELLDLQLDPLSAVDAAGSGAVEGSDSILLRASLSTTAGQPDDVLAAATVEMNEAMPLETANASWAGDNTLEVVNLVSIEVPLAGLDGFTPTMQLAQTLDYEASVRHSGPGGPGGSETAGE